MQVIKPPRRATPFHLLTRIAGPSLIGAVAVAAGLAVSYLALTTPFIAELSSRGQGRLGAPLVGAIVWGTAFLVPGALLVLGAVQMARGLEASLDLRARKRPVASLRRRLSDAYSVAQGVRLPDGRVLPEVVVGPHGVTLVAELPPRRYSRVTGSSWEVRLDSGSWMPIENPVERAARDAERLRNWIALEEEDLAPRVYAAVVHDGHPVAPTPHVSVVRRQELPALFEALPPARHMDPARRARIEALLRRSVRG
jgi:hypothetical protein